MKIEDLKKDLEKNDLAYKGFCHDCSKPVEVIITNEAGQIEISGGAVYKIKRGIEPRMFLKCDSCFEKDHTLCNWQDCDVYSRVVGYMRPVNQWNKGKVAEWNMRKEFITPEEMGE
jgi:hypothetical protein